MKKLITGTLMSVFCVFTVSTQSRAETGRPLTAQCILKASELQNIPPHIVLGLLKTEGGHLGSATLNTNGTRDLGPMQINSTWVDRLSRANFDGDKVQAYNALKYDGCYNVFVGSWIFRQYLDEAGGNYARAVGYYNSHTPAAMQRYQKRFARNFHDLFKNIIHEDQ